jgi:hypothetical protein
MLCQKQQRAGEGGSPVRVKFSRKSLRSFISDPWPLAEVGNNGFPPLQGTCIGSSARTS